MAQDTTEDTKVTKIIKKQSKGLCGVSAPLKNMGRLPEGKRIEHR
jgi:hypothetical protein